MQMLFQLSYRPEGTILANRGRSVSGPPGSHDARGRPWVAYDAPVWIDLSADVGEGPDAVEHALMPHITSANIACGAHAGDEETMRETAMLALHHGVNIGAHPGYPDREGFGRRDIDIDTAELKHSLRSQLETLAAVVRDVDGRIRHVKPHGALYNKAAVDRRLADIVAGVVHAWRSDMVMVGPADSQLSLAAQAVGLKTLAEGFADRAYQPDGSLVPRSHEDAMLVSPEHAAAQALAIVREGQVQLMGGGWVAVRARTICLHGDAPGVLERLDAVRSALLRAGVVIRAPRCQS
jgi:5-oxoprolinase (ATP-hydrolysing) subunit A